MPIARLRERDDAARLEADGPKELMRPAHNERPFAYPAGAAVGKVANNHPSLIEPLEDADRAYLAPTLR
jgi:putative SOS response-associated peptidase YedK